MWPRAGRAILIAICNDPSSGPGTAIAPGVATVSGAGMAVTVSQVTAAEYAHDLTGPGVAPCGEQARTIPC